MVGVGVRICVIALLACLGAAPAARGDGLFEGFNAVGSTAVGADGPSGASASRLDVPQPERPARQRRLVRRRHRAV